MMSGVYSKLLLIFLLLVATLLGVAALQPEFLDYKYISVACFIAVGAGLIAIPIENAIFILFLYIGAEGAAKLLSRYNPVIHVGADILIFSLTAKVAAGLLIGRLEIPKKIPFLVKLMGAHALWFFIVFANPYALSLTASLAGAKMYIVPLILFFFGFYLCSNTKKTEYYLIAWIFVTSVNVVISIYQGAIGPASVTNLSPMYGVVLERFKGYPFRPFGLASQPGGPAVFSYIVISLVLYFFLATRKLNVKAFGFLFFVGMTVVLLLCQVKSAIIKYGASILLFILLALIKSQSMERKIRASIVQFVVAILVALILVLPIVLAKISSGNKTNQEAIQRSLMAFDMTVMGHARSGALGRFMVYVEAAPLGAGLSRIGPAVYRFQDQIDSNPYFHDIGFFSDNFWVELVIDLGVPGVIIFTAIILIALYENIRAIRRAKETEQYLLSCAIFCSLLAIFCGSYGAEPILYNPEASFFWFFSGAMYRFANGDLRGMSVGT